MVDGTQGLSIAPMRRIIKKAGAYRVSESAAKEHAKIIVEEGLLMIYDQNEAEAWRSLWHEILEYRIRPLVSPYRKVINSLIEVVEEITYSEKEKVLDQVMNDFLVWRSLETEISGSTEQPKSARKREA